MFGIYIYSAICIAPQLFINHGFVGEGLLTSCSFDYISRDIYSRSHMVFMFFGGFFIPLAIILIFSLLFFLKFTSILNKLNDEFINFYRVKKINSIKKEFKIMKYICLKLKPLQEDRKLILKGIWDASFTPEFKKCRSVTGYIIYLNSALIDWK